MSYKIADMDALESLGDPVRRYLVAMLATGPLTAGELAEQAGAVFSISQPAVSRHLRVLREVGVVTNAVDGARRVYRLERAPFDEIDAWLDGVLGFWEQRFDALETEIARGKRERRASGSSSINERGHSNGTVG